MAKAITYDLPRVYVVRRGDTLYGRSRKLGIPIIKLTAINSKLNPNRIRPGDPVIIPFGSAQLIAYNNEPQKIATKTHISTNIQKNIKKRAFNNRYYTVKRGDTLWNIAKKFNTSVAELKNRNKLYSANTLLPGKKLKITD
jgi:membrane-bound lytic murein transglycosylase D